MFSKISFGIDADAAGVVTVRAQRQWGVVVAEKLPASSVMGPTTPELADCLRKTLSRVAPARRLVTAAAPAADTIVRRIRVPGVTRTRARKVLPSLLDVQLPFRVEDCAVVVPELRPRRNGVEALASAIHRDALARRRAELAAIGVLPTALDVEGLAVWDAARREFGDPTPAETRAVIHATPVRWVCAFGGADGLDGVVVVRDPPADESSVTWSRAAQIIGSAVATRSGERQIWIWSGRPADTVVRWAQSMAQQRGHMATRHTVISAEPEIMLARALALRALEGAVGAANLLDEDELPPDVRRARDVIAILAAGGLSTASLMLVGVEAWRLSALARCERQLEDFVARQAREVAGLVRVQRGLEVRMAREVIERRLAALSPLDRLFQPSQTTVLAGLLRLATMMQIRLEVIELSDRQARIEGDAPDRDAARRVDDFLRMLGFKPKTEVGAVRPDGRVPFISEAIRS